MNSTTPVIQCNHVAKRFNEGTLNVDVLEDVSLSIGAGEQLAIIGSSGSGKSTLLHLLGGLDNSTNGEIIVNGHNMGSLTEKERGKIRNQSLGFVYQFHHLLPEFTAVENVAMPLLIRRESVATSRKKAEEILKQVGLEHRYDHKPGELSGGERQRAAIARAMVTSPDCILADEPTGNLDRNTADSVYEMLQELNRNHNTSLVIVTHDENLAYKMDRVVRLIDGTLEEVV
jgi:lipoprotein-releasing system ATP-binding protein